jgi:hypothetical protein
MFGPNGLGIVKESSVIMAEQVVSSCIEALKQPGYLSCKKSLKALSGISANCALLSPHKKTKTAKRVIRFFINKVGCIGI